MMWVVLGHTFMYFEISGPQYVTNRQRIFSVSFYIKYFYQFLYIHVFNSVPACTLYFFQLYTDKEAVSPALELVQNATPSVDTFFFLSGLLVGYFTFLQLEKRRFNIVVYYVHRYIRFGILQIHSIKLS